MNLLFANPMYNERMMQALCWTLVHSLWQGLALAILTGAAILFTRRSAPVVRYGLFSILFLLFFLGTCYTFVRQWDHAAARGGNEAPAAVQEQPAAEMFVAKSLTGVVDLPAQPGFLDRMENYFSDHAYFIVALWFIIFSARLVRIMAQLGAVQRLKHYRVHAPAAYWKERLRELADLLGVKIPVTLLESEIVKAPMMTGFIKPVILLPFTLLSQLPAAQVEAILLHELAHIRRRDYFVNLLFSFAEMLFFFNPGVWWICALIREERENCCDDIAVREAGSKKEFISALVSFQQYDRKSVRSAIAFPGSENHLLQRVRRIVYRDNKTLDGREKFFLLFCFLISGVLMLAFTRTAPVTGSWRQGHHARLSVPARGMGHAIKDTVPGDSAEVHDRAVLTTHDYRSVEDSAAQVRVRAERKNKEKEQKEEQKIEQKEQKEKIEQKEQMEQKEKAEADKQRTKMELKDRKEKTEREEQEEKIEAKEQKERAEMDEQKERVEMKERKEQVEIGEQQERMEAGSKRQEIRIAQEEKRMAEQLDQLRREERKLAEEDRKLSEERRRVEQDERSMGNRMYIEREKEKVKASRDLVEARQRDRKLLSSITDDLIREHLIDDREEYAFTLKDGELIVNGNRQSDELLGKFRKKYLGSSGDFVIYSKKKGGSESLSIQIHSISI